MANTYVTLRCHIVFSTKGREPLIAPDLETDLYKYVRGIVTNLGSRCLAINGTENHTHILVSLAKHTALTDLVRHVKSSSSYFVNRRRTTRTSFGWQDGYGGFSVSPASVPAVAEYIRRQKEHHERRSFEDEFRALLRKAEIEFDERYLFD